MNPPAMSVSPRRSREIEQEAPRDVPSDDGM